MVRWIFFILLATPAFTEPLKIGLNAWPGYEEIWLAEKLGYYKDEKLEVKIIQFESLTEGRRAFEKRQTHILPGTLSDLLPTNAKGLNRGRIIAAVDYSNGGDVILSKWESLAKLKGKTIGLEIGSINLFLLERSLHKFNLSIKDVVMKGLPQNKLAEAASTGAVDAVVTYTPFNFEIKKAAPHFKEIFSSRQLPGEILDVMIASDRVLQERKEDVRKLMRAFWRARDFTLKHPDQAIRMMAKRQRISEADYKSTITNDIKLLNYEESKRILESGSEIDRMAQQYGQVLLEIGAIKNPKPLYATDLVFYLEK